MFEVLYTLTPKSNRFSLKNQSRRAGILTRDLTVPNGALYAGGLKNFISLIGKCFILSETKERLFTLAVAAIRQSVRLIVLSRFACSCQYNPACFAIAGV